MAGTNAETIWKRDKERVRKERKTRERERDRDSEKKKQNLDEEVCVKTSCLKGGSSK